MRGESRIVSETRGGISDIESRLSQGLAVVAGLHGGEILGPRIDETRKLKEFCRPLNGGSSRPRSLIERLSRCLDCGLDILDGGFRHLAERGIIGGVMVDSHRPALGGNKDSVDVIF